MSDCIFCKIAEHEIPATVVYEDDLVIAFDDLNPQAPVHTLVIPKAHHENIIDGVPAETLAAMTHAVAEVARIKGLDEGFRVISNKGEAAGQTVMHFHLHVLGGKRWERALSKGCSRRLRFCAVHRDRVHAMIETYV